MLAKPVEQLPPANGLPGGCLYELKWDGYRALIRVDDGARIRSRRGVDLTAAFPDVAEAAAAQLHPSTLLDGELVIWNTDTRSLDFAALQSRLTALASSGSTRRAATLARRRPASLVAFDLLLDAGTPLIGRPLRDRRRALDQLVPLLDPPLQVTPATRSRDATRRVPPPAGGAETTKRLRLRARPPTGGTMTHDYSGMVCAPPGQRAVSGGRRRGLYVFAEERESRDVRDRHAVGDRAAVAHAEPVGDRGHGVQLFLQAHQG
jgi:hypothetical protein